MLETYILGISLKTLLIVCPLVFLAGLVDAIGGGGGLISLPAYLLAGVAPHNAIATNKLSSTLGTVVSTTRYIKNGYFKLKPAIFGILFALIGARGGSTLALRVDGDLFKIMLIVVLPFVACYVIFHKEKESTPKEIGEIKQIIIVSISSLVLGFYDGFYGPGTGTFMLLAYTGLAKMDILSASGNMKLANLASNVSSLVVFMVNKKPIYALGLIAAVFSILGHFLGAGLAMKKGAKTIKYVIILVLILLVIKVVSELV